MVILLQLPISYAIDRTSRIWALLVGAALFAASSATLLLTESFFGILVAFALFFTLAEMILEVAGQPLAAELAPEAARDLPRALRHLLRNGLRREPHRSRSAPRSPAARLHLADTARRGRAGRRRARGFEVSGFRHQQ